MFWAIVSNVLSSIDTVYYKKSLGLATLSNLLFSWLWEFSWLLISVFLVLILWFDQSQLSWNTVLGIALIIWIVTSAGYFDQALYRKEKVSDLLPYENLNSIFVIIIWFLIFRDASVISFVVSIIAFIVTILFSINFKKLTLPRSIRFILIVEILYTAETLLTWRLLKNVPDKEFYVIYEVIVIFILFLPILFKWILSQLKHIKPRFYWYRFGWSMAWNISFLLYLFMVGEFGIVMSILFSFIWTWITLLFGYLFLKETPSKKDIWMTIIIAILVAIGFIFQ
jgi:hypothetical protein